jgi:hypothetical protein
MNWLIMLVVSLFIPIVQPAVQQGINNMQVQVQKRINAPGPHTAVLPPPQYYYDGQNWYCWYAGQWWILCR